MASFVGGSIRFAPHSFDLLFSDHTLGFRGEDCTRPSALTYVYLSSHILTGILYLIVVIAFTQTIQQLLKKKKFKWRKASNQSLVYGLAAAVMPGAVCIGDVTVVFYFDRHVTEMFLGPTTIHYHSFL